MTRKVFPVGVLLAGLLFAGMAWVQPAHAASGPSTVGTTYASPKKLEGMLTV
jgi:hypothetical protein